MQISNYTIEDFVLDPSFKKWVMQPNAESNLHWESLLENNPMKYKDAKRAREIILQLNAKNQPRLSDSEFEKMRKDFDLRLSRKTEVKSVAKDQRVIPIHSISTLEKAIEEPSPKAKFVDYFNLRVACVLIFAISFGAFFSWYFTDLPLPENNVALAMYEEHTTVPGVKSHLTLSDGSQVVLNSGSKLRYLKNFEKNRRELYLTGEAFFNVTQDSLRPFIVRTLETSTTALGTSFNVSAYQGETVDVSLITGKVVVDKDNLLAKTITLLPGEALKIDLENDNFVKSRFDKEEVIGWTKKRIIFQKTPLFEAIRVLENWYGVQIQIKNRPTHQILLSGKFQDETLENVLEGLRFSTRFEYIIDNENVTITF
ncbi:MAG: DUF4974 domain-containing protein [Cytophagales bacterium]|uniref:FecR family protein n=1 Tax=Cyclobacterium marinum TaxID=104 RepID=UPI0030DDD6EE|nr:DUF4974 domain-containing protein [Cytophagales bacterium]|tara:strand:- start:32835 stop:33944 length:1110 start_codon:yes stop_codon:yes gene_type:complete